MVEFKKATPNVEAQAPTVSSEEAKADEDEIVWWKADDPSTNEGVEPPHEEPDDPG